MFFEQRGFELFSVGGVEVSVSVWYAILMGFVIVLWPSLGAMTITAGVLWALAITFSLLVHEFGHALVAKHYNLSPSILLHAFGGFCITDREARSDGDDARVVFAGPMAGLVLAALVGLVYFVAPGLVAASPVTQTLVTALLWVNVVWSLVNLLLPIWPLDGGRLFHLFLRRFQSEDKARRWTLNASIFTVIPVGILGFIQFSSLLVAIFALFVVMDNARALKMGTPLVRRKSGRTKNKASSFHEELFAEAQKAMDDGDWEEAARLGHHMRAVGSMPSKMLEQVWMVLGLSTMEMGDYEEALKYLERAPKKSKIEKAIERCRAQLDDEKLAG